MSLSFSIQMKRKQRSNGHHVLPKMCTQSGWCKSLESVYRQNGGQSFVFKALGFSIDYDLLATLHPKTFLKSLTKLENKNLHLPGIYQIRFSRHIDFGAAFGAIVPLLTESVHGVHNVSK